MGTDNRLIAFGLPFLLETKTIAEATVLTKELGLSFVELNSNFPQCQINEMDPFYLLEQARTNKIYYTLHLDDALNIADFNVRVREAYVESVLAAIRLAIAAEIPLINIHLAKGNIVTLPDGKHYLFEDFTERFEGALRSFRDRCTALIGEHDLLICIENTDGWANYELNGIDILLESPVFALTLDIGHDHATGNTDLAFIKQRKDRLRHMHAHDGKGTINHQALGSGEIPVAERLSLARDCRTTVVLETKTIAALRESVDWLHLMLLC